MTNADLDKPLVAVILVAYGGKDDTLACIESISNSNYPGILIILVDNDSPDDTSLVVSKVYPEVKIIQSERNLGFAGGNNLGIKYALEICADYVFLLNNDTEIERVTISKFVESSENIENLGAVGPLIYYHSDKDKIWSAGGRISFRWSFLEHIGLRELDNGQYNIITDVDYLTGCALFVPSSRFNEIGYLNEEYWMYYEDADFCMRLKKSGYRILLNPEGKVWHKISSSTGGNLSKRKIWFKLKSGFKFFNNFSPSPFWFITYPLSQLVNFFRALKVSKV